MQKIKLIKYWTYKYEKIAKINTQKIKQVINTKELTDI